MFGLGATELVIVLLVVLLLFGGTPSASPNTRPPAVAAQDASALEASVPV